MPLIVGYSEWVDWQLKQLEEPGARLLCPHCMGSKWVEIECDCCGNFSEQECDLEHDENGWVWAKDCDADELEKELTRFKYYQAVMADAKDLAGFIGRDFAVILIENGFKVFSQTATKRVEIERA